MLSTSSTSMLDHIEHYNLERNELVRRRYVSGEATASKGLQGSAMHRCQGEPRVEHHASDRYTSSVYVPCTHLRANATRVMCS